MPFRITGRLSSAEMMPDSAAAAATPGKYESVRPNTNHSLYGGFWEGTKAGEIRLPFCGTCQEYHWYPLRRCPFCGNRGWEWKAVGTNATLFSWAVISRALAKVYEDRLGDIVALVVPAAAPRVRLVTNIIDVPANDLVIGMELVAEFVRLGDIAIPVFRSVRR